MGPVVGDRILRVVTEFFHRLDFKTTLAQAVENDPVSAGRKAVAVREDDARIHVVMERLSNGMRALPERHVTQCGARCTMDERGLHTDGIACRLKRNFCQ